jgi:hypothetical protein
MWATSSGADKPATLRRPHPAAILAGSGVAGTKQRVNNTNNRDIIHSLVTLEKLSSK